MELKRLVNDKEDEKKKKKNIALIVTKIKDIESEDKYCPSKSNEFMFHKFKEILKHEK